MKNLFIVLGIGLMAACGQQREKTPTAQEIVDRAIAVSGGDRYTSSQISFEFRGRRYVLEPSDQGRVLKRVSVTDSGLLEDSKMGSKFMRKLNDSLVSVADSMASRYANSINSVHYFAYLPYGLNDPAVNKKLLGKTVIDGEAYYKVQITFDREGGGKDFEDVYVHWFNASTFELEYLAYDFLVDGGGVRFRKAFNERYVEGIRFVDYENYSFKQKVPPALMDSLYQTGALQLLSRIELRDIEVNPGSGS